MKNEALKTQIVGTWKLVSIFYEDKNRNQVNLYGEKPMGVLMYDKFGNMNAQLGYSDREKMSSASLTDGSVEEKSHAFDSYMAYYGKYYEKEAGVIIHEVEGCMIPNWEGENEIRYVKIEGNFLYISTPETKIAGHNTVIQVVWERST